MLKYCANLSLLFTEYPLLERFAAAKNAGFDAVEIQFPYELPAVELHDAAEKAQVKIVLINLPAGDLMSGGAGLACVPNKTAEFREAVDLCLEYADILNVECVNVLAGRLVDSFDYDQCFSILVENSRLCAERFEAINVKVLTEAINHFDMPGFLISSFESMQDVIRAVAHSNVAMQFDIYHMTRMGEDVASLIRDNYAQMGHIQFADVPGRGAPGTGNIEFFELFTLIEALPYHGWCGAEYKPNGATKASLRWRHAYDLLL